jgi:hypothetical protein
MRFFRNKSEGRAGESSAGGVESVKDTPSSGTNTLVDGLTKVNELVVNLGRLYQAHPETDNEILIKVASNLTCYSLALTQILGVDITSVLGNAQKAELSRLLKDTEELLPSPLESEVKRSLQGPNIRCEEAVLLFTRQMNMYSDIGSKFLMAREMRASGFSDAMINSALSQKRPNIF